MLQPGACRLKLVTAQQELHDQLMVMRCEKYVAEALHAADLEAEEQASSLAALAIVCSPADMLCASAHSM